MTCNDRQKIPVTEAHRPPPLPGHRQQRLAPNCPKLLSHSVLAWRCCFSRNRCFTERRWWCRRNKVFLQYWGRTGRWRAGPGRIKRDALSSFQRENRPKGKRGRAGTRVWWARCLECKPQGGARSRGPASTEGHPRGSASSLTYPQVRPWGLALLYPQAGVTCGSPVQRHWNCVKGEKLLSRTQYPQNKTYVSQPTFITKNTDLESSWLGSDFPGCCSLSCVA